MTGIGKVDWRNRDAMMREATRACQWFSLKGVPARPFKTRTIQRCLQNAMFDNSILSQSCCPEQVDLPCNLFNEISQLFFQWMQSGYQ
jgi:hypothetical protein